MNAKQITAAITFQAGDDTDNLIQALRTADDDQMIDLLEKIRNAVRKDTVTDILADLKAEGEDEAHSLIEENY